MRSIPGAALAMLCAGATTAAAQQSAPPAERPAASPPAITVRHLHDAMINPASDAFFNVGSEAPKSDKDWAALRNNIVIMAESGALLQIGGRAKDRGVWVRMSREFREAGVRALKAAEAKDLDALMKVSDRIVYICEDCHEKYRDGGRSMHK